MCCIVIQAGGCATAELSQRTVEEPAERYYRYFRLSIELSDSEDTIYLTNKFINELERYGMEIILSKHSQSAIIIDQAGTALLRVEEIERRIETVEHRRTYGRTSLTQNRGRKFHDKPVISLRATLIDNVTRRAVFQADYVTQGPWYSDSATVVASLAGILLKQLEQENFIEAR